MKKTTFIFLTISIISSFCFAHEMCQQPVLSPPTSPPEAAVIAKGLQEHFRYLFSKKQLDSLDKIHQDFLTVAEEMTRATNDTSRGAAQKKLEQTDKELIQLLDNYKNLIDVDISIPGFAKMDLEKKLSVTGDSVGAIFRIKTCDGPVSFTTAKWDMKRKWEATPEVLIPYCSTGTTYALAGYRNIPHGKSDITVYFSPINNPPVTSRGFLSFETPETGILDFSMTDENGESTPAMIRLVSLTDNYMRVPGGALEFSDQFEPSTPPPGYRTDVRYIQYNGPLFGKNFHCVPGPFNMGLPPGEYEIAVFKGVEYIPIQDKFTIRSGETTKFSAKMKRWSNMAEKGWYSGDDHVHGAIMNDKDAYQLLTFAKATDTHVVNILCMGDHRQIWFPQRGFGKKFRVIDGDYMLVPGQEGPRYFMGHAVGMNLKQLVRFPEHYLLNEKVAEKIHEDGGLYGQAHLAHKLFGIERDLFMQVPLGNSDFGEILQFNHLGTELYYQILNLGYKLAASAGSDVPYGGSIGDVRIYAYTGKSFLPFMNKKFTADDWFEAVRSGKTFVSNGPMLDFHVDGEGPGSEILIKKNKTLRVTAKAVGLKNGCSPAKLMIFSHGKIIKEITSDNPAQETLELDFDFDVEFGTWIAACAFGHDGSRAHTTPVYVVREGYRFWDIKQVPELIANCYATLDSLEKSILDIKKSKTDGSIDPLNHFGMGIANQADEVLASIKKVRTKYKELESIYQKELKSRKK